MRLAHAAVAIAALLLVLGRVPSLTNDFCDPDIAVMSYGGQDLLAGGTIYENAVETKPPGAYILFAAILGTCGHSLVPIYVVALLLHLLTLLLAARMGGRMAGPAGMALVAWCYAALAIDQDAAANCPNQETWMAFFAFFGFYFLVPRQGGLRPRAAVAAGAMLGVAVLMKQQAAVFGAAAVFWLLADRTRDRVSRVEDVVRLAAGAAAPIALVLLYWAAKGGLATLLTDLNPSRLRQYVGAAGSGEMWDWAWRRAAPYVGTSWPLWAAVIGGGGLWAARRDRDGWWVRLAVFLAAGALAVIAGSRFFPHYFIIPAAALALAAGYGFAQLGRLPLGRAWRGAILGVCFALIAGTAHTELATAGRVLGRVATGETPFSEAMRWSLPRHDPNLENRFEDRPWHELGDYLRAHSGPTDTLYVWPYLPQLYFWADRRSPTKHYMYFDLAVNLPFKHGGWHTTVDPVVGEARRTLLHDLETRRTKFVVLPIDRAGWNHAFDELEDYVAAHYDLDTAAPPVELRVFRRRPDAI